MPRCGTPGGGTPTTTGTSRRGLPRPLPAGQVIGCAHRPTASSTPTPSAATSSSASPTRHAGHAEPYQIRQSPPRGANEPPDGQTNVGRRRPTEPPNYALRVLRSPIAWCSPSNSVHVPVVTVHSHDHRRTALEATKEATQRSLPAEFASSEFEGAASGGGAGHAGFAPYTSGPVAAVGAGYPAPATQTRLSPERSTGCAGPLAQTTASVSAPSSATGAVLAGAPRLDGPTEQHVTPREVDLLVATTRRRSSD